MKGVDLAGRRALVTGGSRGIGAAVARALAACGAEVIVAYRADDESARATTDAIARDGGRARLLKANLARPEEVKALLRARGDDVFLEDELDDVGDPLEEALRPDPVRTLSDLEPAEEPPLDPGEDPGRE